MLNNFIYSQTKDLFLEKLDSGQILNEAIVFIEETGEIWNRGNYFGSKVDISGCATQEEVQNIVLGEFAKLSKVATTGLYSDLIDKPTVPQHIIYETEALYQEAVDAGEVDENDISFVKETGKIHTQGGVYGGGSEGGIEFRQLYVFESDPSELTEEQKAYNIESYTKIEQGERIVLFIDAAPIVGILTPSGTGPSLRYYQNTIIVSSQLQVIDFVLTSEGLGAMAGVTLYPLGGSSDGVEAAILEFNTDGSALTAEQKAHNAEIYNKMMAGDKLAVYVDIGGLISLTRDASLGQDGISFYGISLLNRVTTYVITFVLRNTGEIFYSYYNIDRTIDTELSDTSENAVQNKTVTSEFNKIWEIIGAKDFSSDFNTDYAIY